MTEDGKNLEIENKITEDKKSEIVEEKIIQGKSVSKRKRTLILINLSITGTAAGIMATSLTTALPLIMEDLNIDLNTGQWLTSGFGLFLAIVTPFSAFLIKRFKTKRLYCTSLLLFMIGLIICAVSNQFWIMMVGRIVQGSGSGLMNSMSQVIILNIYPPDKVGTAMGWYGFSFSVAPIVAPTLAGIIVDTIGWRMIFISATTVMGISLIFALFVMENVLPLMKRSFDTISFIISAFAFGGITLAIGNVGKYDIISYQVLMVFIIGLVSMVIFVIRQLHQKLPFLDLRILKDIRFCVATVAIFILQLTILGNAIILPIYVQQIKKRSATISGLTVLPGSLASAFVSPIAGKIYDKIGIKFLYFGGAFSLALSGLLIYFVSYDTSIWIVSIINILRCIAIALFNMPVFTWGMGNIHKNRTSDASALNNSIRAMGGALGSAMFVSILTKVESIVKDTKEHPDMYGYNVVYLIMSILGLLIIIIGIFGIKSTNNGRKGKVKKTNSSKPEKSTSMKEMKSLSLEKNNDETMNKVEIVIENDTNSNHENDENDDNDENDEK